MTETDIEKAVGRRYEIDPVPSAFSAPPTEFELANTPVYAVHVAAMGVAMYLNSFKKVVHIRFLFGKDKGRVVMTIPTVGELPGTNIGANSRKP